MSSEEFTHHILRTVIGRVCQPLGVHGMNQSVCDCMADVLKQYILTLGRTTASYSSHANRTEPNLSDVFQAFRDLGINLSELSEFTKEVESVTPPQTIPRYPVPRSSTHVYTAPSGGKPAAVTHRSRTGSLSSEDEYDRDHIPPYLPPLPLEAEDQKEEGEEHEAPDQLEMAESVPMDTRPPPDPSKGLPQLSRSRRLSSDFSEEGENAGSRRNSISNGAPLRTPSVLGESGLISASDSRGTGVAGKEVVESGEGAYKVLSPSITQKVNVFDVAFSKKLSENEARQEKPTKPVQQVQEIPKTGEAPPTLTKPVKLDLQAAQPAQPVIFQKPQQPVGAPSRVLPPPLKLMSPTSAEHPNTIVPTQQPPLSPLTTRSPVQSIIGMPRMPVLSPLRTPTSGNRHPMRISSGGYGLNTTGSPLMSPPALRSPVDSAPPPIDAHPHGGMPPASNVSVPRMHVATPPTATPIPYSAHPPLQPYSLQAQPTASSQPLILPTSAVSPEKPAVSGADTGRSTQDVALPDDKPSEISLKEDEVHHEQMQNITPERLLSVSSSSEASSPGVPADTKNDSEEVLEAPPLEEAEKSPAAMIEGESPSPLPLQEEEGEEREDVDSSPVNVSQTERLSASPVSATGHDTTRFQISPGKVAAVGETILKDLEISDDEGLSEDEDEEEGSEEVLLSKPSSPVEAEEEKGSFLSETEVAAPISGKKMVKEAASPSPVSSPGSEFDDVDQIKLKEEEEEEEEEGVDDEEFSTQEALSLVHVSKETEEVDAGKDLILSPENLLNLSSDEEEEIATEATIDRPIRSPVELDSALEGHEEITEDKPGRGDTKVKVLESAGVPFVDEDMRTVEEVLEVLEQKLSSDEESEESGGEKERVEEEGEGGVASEIGVVSGEGVMVGEEEDMVETLSAMVQPPQATLTTELITVTTKSVSRDDVLGIKLPPPRQAPPKPLKISFKRHLVPSLRPEPPPKPPSPSPPPPTVTKFLTKAEKKADIASHLHRHHHHQVHGLSASVGGGGGGGGGGLIVTPGETKSLPLQKLLPPAPAVVPHTPSASPSPAPESESEPLLISINRRLLRHSRFGIPTPVEERPRLSTATALKMKLARFGAIQAPPTGVVVSSHVTTTPSVNPRKRDRDSDSGTGTTLLVGREVKRSRQESPPVQVPSRQVSSSSSSSSSSSDDEEESGSEDSASRSPSPFRQPVPPPPSSVVSAPSHSKHHPTLVRVQMQRVQMQHHRSQYQLHRAHTPSSVDEEEQEEEEKEEEEDDDEDTRALTPASSESGSTLGSGGGLKLTISKAVLKQASLSQHKTSTSVAASPAVTLSKTLFVGPAGSDSEAGGRGGRRGSKGSKRGRGGGGKRGRKGSMSSKQAAASSVSVKSSQPKKVKRKDIAGAAKKSSSKPTPKIQVQSSNPVIIKLPTTKTRSSKAVSSGRGIISSLPSTAATATASGSDYHCPECGLRDDGSPMIGCDGCDSWVHWTCVGITREPPDDEKWFCPTCVKSRQSGKKKKGRKRKRTH